MTSQKKVTRLTSRFIRLAGDKIASRGKGERKLCILNFHRILESFDPLLESEPDIGTFHWQMELLAECFNVMPLDEALQSLAAEDVPPRAVCITFDDGYRSTYDLALPVLKKFGLPATIFVTSGYIGEGSMWNDKILETVRCLPDAQLDLREISLGVHSIQTLAERKRVIKKLTDAAKYLPPHKRVELDMKFEQLAEGNRSPGLMLTRDMICALEQQGIEIGAHTISHPILTSLDDARARHEIEGGKHHLEEIIGKPVRFFAYPNGKTGLDFDARHVSMAKEAGFKAAFTTAFGAATKKHNQFQIPRSRPWDSTPFFYGMRLLHWLATRNN